MTAPEAGEQPNLAGSAWPRRHLGLAPVAAAVSRRTGYLLCLPGLLSRVGCGRRPSSRCPSWIAIAASARASRGVSVPQERHTHASPSVCIRDPHSSQNRTYQGYTWLSETCLTVRSQPTWLLFRPRQSDTSGDLIRYPPPSATNTEHTLRGAVVDYRYCDDRRLNRPARPRCLRRDRRWPCRRLSACRGLRTSSRAGSYRVVPRMAGLSGRPDRRGQPSASTWISSVSIPSPIVSPTVVSLGRSTVMRSPVESSTRPRTRSPR